MLGCLGVEPEQEVTHGNCQMYQRLGNTKEENRIWQREAALPLLLYEHTQLLFYPTRSSRRVQPSGPPFLPPCPGRLRGSSRNSLKSSVKQPSACTQPSPLLPVRPAQPSTHSHELMLSVVLKKKPIVSCPLCSLIPHLLKENSPMFLLDKEQATLCWHDLSCREQGGHLIEDWHTS